MIVFWLLVVACIGVLIAVMRRSRGASAIEILQIRYARGEITHDQFEQMKRALAADGPATKDSPARH
jgi:uncharacterized membrane protein